MFLIEYPIFNSIFELQIKQILDTSMIEKYAFRCASINLF
jgi:hypothetical protein